jgi:transglutaminase-like putative cysteine protease
MRSKAPSYEERLKKQTHISVERYFEISLLLSLGTAFLTLASTGKLDLPSVALVSCALLIRLWGYVKERDLSLSPRTVSRLAIFYIFFFWLDLFVFSSGPTLLDSMLTATVHLILFATVVKVFSPRSYRDYAYLATLSFMMMLASAILTVSTTYLAFFILYALFAISTFISYEIKRSMEAASDPPRGPFPHPVRNRAELEKALSATAIGLVAGTMVLAALLFFVIPRYRTGYLTGLGSTTENITGFSESVNLGDIGRIKRSNEVVMRVIPAGDPRNFMGVKWRGVALDSFDGRHWYNDNTDQVMFPPASYHRFIVPPGKGVLNRPRRILRYRVLLSSVSTDVLFAAAVPEEIFGRFRMLSLDQTRSLHNPQHFGSPVQYEVISQVGMPSPGQLRAAPAHYSEEMRFLYLRLPPQLDPRIKELAQTLTAHATNNYDRAIAIRDYLRDHFTYTLNPAGIQPNHPISSFLFQVKKGYCEYFASAMAVMLRTLGIPARIVNGFQTGSYNTIGKDFVVLARDAHRWVEVYFPGYGWIPFDPTPPNPYPVIPSKLDDYLDALSLFWNEWIINYDFTHQVELVRRVALTTKQFQGTARQRLLGLKQRGIRLASQIELILMKHKLLVLALMAAIVGWLMMSERELTWGEIRIMWALRFPRHNQNLSPHEATLTYQRFLALTRKRGFRKTPSETPREFARRLEGSSLGRMPEEFTMLYNASRYGRNAIPLSRLRTLLDAMRQSPPS